jgi:hypothetical protein
MVPSQPLAAVRTNLAMVINRLARLAPLVVTRAPLTTRKILRIFTIQRRWKLRKHGLDISIGL